MAAFSSRCRSRSTSQHGSWLTSLIMLTLLTFSEIRSISCQPGVDRAHNGPIRLERDGSVSQRLTSGRVQVYILRHWAYICDDSSFGITEANVICHQLGYTGAISQSNAQREGLGPGNFSISRQMGGVKCSSSLLINIHQCSYSTGAFDPSCTREVDATVSCYPTRSWDNPYSGQVRLVGGSTVNQGLVEVYCNGRWGTVCAGPTLGSLARLRDVANSVCRQLGYTKSYRVLHLTELSNSSLLNSSQPVWVGDISDVNCRSGGEDCLSYCQSCPNFVFPSCPHQLLTVECYAPYRNVNRSNSNTNTTCTLPAVKNGPIQLWRNGTTSLSYTSGRVQLLVRRMWGNICHDSSFNSNAADVICHQLGFTGAASYSREGEDGFGSDNLPQVLGEVHCSTSDFLVILQCSYSEYVDSSCTPSDDLSVICYKARIWDNPSNGRVRLVLGDTVNRGIVEVYCNGQWGRVCGDNFSATAGHSVCRQLGYSDVLRSNHLPIHRTMSAFLPVWLNNVRCPSSSPELHISVCQSCPSVARGKCGSTDATVECFSSHTFSPRPPLILGLVIGAVLFVVLAIPLTFICLCCYLEKKSQIHVQNGNSPRQATNAERSSRQLAQTERSGQDNFRFHMPSGATANDTPSDPTITEVAPPPYHTYNEYTTCGDGDEKKSSNEDPPPYSEIIN